jgi:hypothetical protein
MFRGPQNTVWDVVTEINKSKQKELSSKVISPSSK